MSYNSSPTFEAYTFFGQNNRKYNLDWRGSICHTKKLCETANVTNKSEFSRVKMVFEVSSSLIFLVASANAANILILSALPSFSHHKW